MGYSPPPSPLCWAALVGDGCWLVMVGVSRWSLGGNGVECIQVEAICLFLTINHISTTEAILRGGHSWKHSLYFSQTMCTFSQAN